MKGKETKKEKKKEKTDAPTVKGQSDYQKDKTSRSNLIPIVNKPKK